MEIQFKTKNKKQLEAARCWIDDTVSELVFGGGKGGGKSFLGANLIFGDALIYPGTHYFIARKELNDLRKFTIPTIHEVFKCWGLKLEDYATFNGQDNVFKLKNGSQVFLIACNEVPSDPLYERFGSMQMTRGWIEEAGEVVEAAKANLYLSIGRWKNEEYKLKKKLLMTCNPKKGWLKRDYIDPYRDGILEPSKRYIRALVTDNPYLPEDYVESLRNEKDPVRRARLFEGDWDYDDDETALLTDMEISSIFTNEGVPGRRYMTIDPAFMGKDEMVIYVWNGYIVEFAYVFQKMEEDNIVPTIDFYLKLHNVERRYTISDATGIGSYVPKFLRGIRGFVGASSPIKDEDPNVPEMEKPFFNNLRSQCVWHMAMSIKKGKVAFKVKDENIKKKLVEELEQWKVVAIDDDKKIEIISKEEVRESIGRSPDYSDALYERAFMDLDPEAIRGMSDETARKQAAVIKKHFSKLKGI